jgi:hypothetical protein
MTGRPSRGFDVIVPWDAGAALAPVLPLAVLLAIVFVTGVASYWFHPRALSVVRQNRAVALSYYGCAPLAFASIPVLALIAVLIMKEAGLDDQANASWTVVRLLEITAGVVSLLVVGSMWRSTLTLLSRTTHSGTGRLVLAGLLVPLTWALCFAFVMATLPWVIGFVRLVVGSLR